MHPSIQPHLEPLSRGALHDLVPVLQQILGALRLPFGLEGEALGILFLEPGLDGAL